MYALGWQKDPPDIRDFDLDVPQVQPMLLRCPGPGSSSSEFKPLPASYAIPKLPPVKDQDRLSSCVAHAGTTMLETYALMQGYPYQPLSRRFLYKVTRDLLGWKGDRGAYLRTMVKALTLVGAPPEKFWGYDVLAYEAEPPPLVFSVAQGYQASLYYRLDRFRKIDKTTESVKINLAANRACALGFMVYTEALDARTGEARLPVRSDTQSGGHAVCLVGYDDNRRIGGCTGAFKFANSWTTGWGDRGYGYLPYDYITEGLASDVWTVMKAAWTDLEVFRNGAEA